MTTRQAALQTSQERIGQQYTLKIHMRTLKLYGYVSWQCAKSTLYVYTSILFHMCARTLLHATETQQKASGESNDVAIV